MKWKYAIVNAGAAPVRKKARHASEMVNQLLFGEAVRVLKEKDELWVKVISLQDNYEGWMTNTLLEPADEVSAKARSAFASAKMFSHVLAGDKKINIPFGSSLPLLEGMSGKIGDQSYAYPFDAVKRDEKKATPALLRAFALPWLNSPYLWGGRTPLGVDCSGFVQVIFKTLGIDLPRDTWQQAKEGEAVKKFKDAKPGDLIFFSKEGKIMHVGILLEQDEMIHSSGKVRIDKVNKKGIVQDKKGKRTIRLEVIRRIL